MRNYQMPYRIDPFFAFWTEYFFLNLVLKIAKYLFVSKVFRPRRASPTVSQVFDLDVEKADDKKDVEIL